MKEIKIEELNENPFKLIGKDWMFITAEKEGSTNMMTASWGGLGVLWGKNVATVYIRPSRYTKTFIDAGDHFSLCVMDEKYRKELNYCGAKSGRDEDKVQECGFNVEKADGTVFFKESRLVLICKKLYSQKMDASLLNDEKLRTTFWNDDVHEMYIAEIEKVYVAEGDLKIPEYERCPKYLPDIDDRRGQGDDRGHLIAHEFGGADTEGNLVPLK